MGVNLLTMRNICMPFLFLYNVLGHSVCVLSLLQHYFEVSLLKKMKILALLPLPRGVWVEGLMTASHQGVKPLSFICGRIS